MPAFCPKDWILLPSNDFFLLRSAGNICNSEAEKNPIGLLVVILAVLESNLYPLLGHRLNLLLEFM